MLGKKMLSNPKLYIIIAVAISFILGSDFLLISLVFFLSLVEMSRNRRLFRFIVLGFMLVGLMVAFTFQLLVSNMYFYDFNISLSTLSYGVGIGTIILLLGYIALIIESFIGRRYILNYNLYRIALALPVAAVLLTSLS